MGRSLLIIDDDRDLQERLAEYLREYGYTVKSHFSGAGAVAAVQELRPDLVILDIMMPVKDGLEVLQELRRIERVPVLMLTARGDDMDRVVGLEMGADDYLPKPFNPRELLARIKAILRRGEQSDQKKGDVETARPLQFSCGPLILDPGTRALSCGGNVIELSATEFRILEALITNKNLILSREKLMEMVHDRELEVFDRSIDVQISRLRGRLEQITGSKEWIKTYRGSGYMLVDSL